MITYRYSLVAMLLGLPLGATALELRDPATHALVAVPMTGAPSEATDARQAAPKLRDSLRQPLSDNDAAGKPYRLTPEERQRLREQLRGRSEQAARQP